MTGKKAIDILADRVKRLACAKCGHHIDLTSVEPFAEVECPECGTKQVAPMRLGAFLLVEEMGKGGMGSVFRAYDQTLGRYVAIKVMQKHLAADKKFADNFLREARAAAALNDPHVVQIYSCGQEQGQLYIVMELVSGGRLDQMLEGGKALDEVFTLEVGVQIAKGLQAANEIGLIHGDIKPANILFDKQRQAKVVDFGLARFAAQQRLQPGEIWGTPYYIAPEKVRSQKEDHRADIYSLGATLYHALSGQPPFEGETAKEVVLARLKGPAISLRTVRPSVQPETAAVIARTLEAEPAQRYPTYTSLLADLEEALKWAREREGLPPADGQGSLGRKLGWLAGGLLFVALLGGAFFFLRADDPEPPPPPTPPSVVYDEDPEATEPEPSPDADPEIIFDVQPFAADAQTAIENAVGLWLEGRATGYETRMDELFRSMPRVGVERPWVSVLQALPAWWDGRDASVERYLRGIQDATLRELEGDQLHPGIMPQSLARFLLGLLDADELAEIAADWPDWFADLTRYVVGARAVKAGQFDEALTHWEPYLDRTPPDDVQWPYVFQAHAAQWQETISEWRSLERRAAELPPDEARQALRTYRAEVPALLHAPIDAALRAAGRRAAAEEAERAAAERAAHEEHVREEKAAIDAAREELFGLVRERDFRRAAAQLRQMTSTPQTDEARAYRERLLESYQRMDDLRRLIITGIQENPVTRRDIPLLPSDTLGASTSGIQFVLGEHGSMERDWSQINVRLLAELAEHYIARLPEAEQANHRLSLAVLAYQHRSLRPARLYADRALEADAELRADAEALMPELEWEQD